MTVVKLSPAQNPLNAEIEKLSAGGPQLPPTFNPSDIQLRGLINGGWPLHIEYELGQPGTVTLTVSVDGFPPFIAEFRGMQAGRHEELLHLPRELGGLNVATYAIKAVDDTPGAAGLESFVLLSLAVGNSVGSSGLYRLSFQPRDVRVARNRPSHKVTYSFQTRRPFSGGANADIYRVDGLSEVRVGRQSYDRKLKAGETVTGSWDCMRDGEPSLGRHQLLVQAWFTIRDGDGSFALAQSSPVVVRR
jgi:hypothetical protein